LNFSPKGALALLKIWAVSIILLISFYNNTREKRRENNIILKRNIPPTMPVTSMLGLRGNFIGGKLAKSSNSPLGPSKCLNFSIYCYVNYKRMKC